MMRSCPGNPRAYRSAFVLGILQDPDATFSAATIRSGSGQIAAACQSGCRARHRKNAARLSSSTNNRASNSSILVVAVVSSVNVLWQQRACNAVVRLGHSTARMLLSAGSSDRI
jgi:hypothetical protein